MHEKKKIVKEILVINIIDMRDNGTLKILIGHQKNVFKKLQQSVQRTKAENLSKLIH